MIKRRIILLSAQHLLCESLQNIFAKVEDLEVIGPLAIDEKNLDDLPLNCIDPVLIIEENTEPELIAHIMGKLLEKHPDLPIFTVTFERNTVRFYHSHALPAKSTDLLDVIRSLPVPKNEVGEKSGGEKTI